MATLNARDIIAALPVEWRLGGGVIAACYSTGDFTTGLGFVNAVGQLAERANHHPDITLSYPQVHLSLVSHDVGGVTDRDVALAQQIAERAATDDIGYDRSRRFQASNWVPADRARVYDVLSDVTRTGEWSPTTRACEWNSADRGVGATFTGHNQTPERQWTTTSSITEADPGKRFAWVVNHGWVQWAYDMKAHDEGTLLTLSWHFTEAGIAGFDEKYGQEAPVQVTSRESSARHDIPITLQRIAAILLQEEPRQHLSS